MCLSEIKQKSESYLKRNGFEPNLDLPLIESLDEVLPRSVEDVASRMFAMSNLIGMGYGAKRSKLKRDLKSFQLWTFVTTSERRDLNSFRINEETKVRYQ